jgi:hypothetical protein
MSANHDTGLLWASKISPSVIGGGSGGGVAQSEATE